MRYHELTEIFIGKFAPDDEIIDLIPRRWEQAKKKSKLVTKIKDLDLYADTEISTEERTRFFLLDKNNPVGQLTLSPYGGSDYFYVVAVWINPKYRNKGYIKALYDYILNKGVKLLSDHGQTLASKNLWMSFFPKYNMYIVDRNNDTPIKIINKEQIEAAYGDDNLRLLVTK